MRRHPVVSFPHSVCALAALHRKLVVPLAAIVALSAIAASSEAAAAGFCRVADHRMEGTAGTMRQATLWTYPAQSAPFHPVFGWVDMACWNTAGGVSIDIAKRAWFAVSGPENGAPSDAKIQFADSQTLSTNSSVGVTTKGLDVVGSVAPGHDCVFEIRVWQDSCPTR